MEEKIIIKQLYYIQALTLILHQMKRKILTVFKIQNYACLKVSELLYKQNKSFIDLPKGQELPQYTITP